MLQRICGRIGWMDGIQVGWCIEQLTLHDGLCSSPGVILLNVKLFLTPISVLVAQIKKFKKTRYIWQMGQMWPIMNQDDWTFICLDTHKETFKENCPLFLWSCFVDFPPFGWQSNNFLRWNFCSRSIYICPLQYLAVQQLFVFRRTNPSISQCCKKHLFVTKTSSQFLKNVLDCQS